MRYELMDTDMDMDMNKRWREMREYIDGNIHERARLEACLPLYLYQVFLNSKILAEQLKYQ